MEIELIRLIADAAGVVGMGFFLKAEIFQLKKILRTKTVRGISKTAYRDKLLAITATLVCFGLTALWFSFAVIFAEGIIAIIIFRLIRKYNKKGWHTLPEEEFKKELKTW